MLKDLITQNRTRRRFYQEEVVSMETLRDLIDMARLSMTGQNKQGLRFYLSNTPEENAKVFSTLGWAGALPEWPGPQEGERPSAYVVIAQDTEIKPGLHDTGIAANNILLGATEKGLGGLMFGSVKFDELHQLLGMEEKHKIVLVVAIGKPKEIVVMDAMPADGKWAYWRDENQVHHVPKRTLDDLIISK